MTNEVYFITGWYVKNINKFKTELTMEELVYDEVFVTVMALMQKHIDRDLARDEDLINANPGMEEDVIKKSIEKSTKAYITAFTENNHVLNMAPEIIRKLVIDVSQTVKMSYQLAD